MTMKVTVTSDQQEFVKTTETICNKIADIETCWKQIQGILESSGSYWLGNAGQANYRYYMDITEEVTKLMQRIKTAQQMLRQQSGLFDSETDVNEENGLPDDLLV